MDASIESGVPASRLGHSLLLFTCWARISCGVKTKPILMMMMIGVLGRVQNQYSVPSTGNGVSFDSEWRSLDDRSQSVSNAIR